MDPRTPTISGLSEAMRVALALHDLYGRFAAAAVVDDLDGTLLDLRPFAGEAACVVCAVEWALQVADDWHHAHRIVLLSGDGHPVREPRELDIRIFQEVRRELRAHGMTLVDWIQTDGDDLRSMTLTCDVRSGWDDDEAPA